MWHVAEVHKGRKSLRCDVPGCDFVTINAKHLRKHMREGRHGKLGKRGEGRNNLANNC